MAIPAKINCEFYIQTIENFCRPLAERAAINGVPCQWIQDLDLEHAPISQQMREGIAASKTIFDNHLKKLRWLACTAAIGLGVGFGGFMAFVAGGGVLSIALGIIGAIGGLIAGVFIGLSSANEQAFRKTRPHYQTAHTVEKNWIEGKMAELNQRISDNDPDTVQLQALKFHFEAVIAQHTALVSRTNKNEWCLKLFGPSKGSNEAQLLEAWYGKNATS